MRHDTRAEILADIATQFDALTSNGGFLDSFGSEEAPLDQVVEALTFFGLRDAAKLVRRGADLLPSRGAGGVDARQAEVDNLADDDAEVLEALGERYLERHSNRLGSAIERYWQEHPNEGPPELSMPLPAEARDLAALYVVLAAAHERYSEFSVARANAVSDRIRQVGASLAGTEGGREHLGVLLDHASSSVRRFAAIEVMQGDRQRAVPVLRREAAADPLFAPGVQSILDD